MAGEHWPLCKSLRRFYLAGLIGEGINHYLLREAERLSAAISSARRMAGAVEQKIATLREKHCGSVACPTFRRSEMEFPRNFFSMVCSRLTLTGRFGIDETLGLFLPGA